MHKNHPPALNRWSLAPTETDPPISKPIVMPVQNTVARSLKNYFFSPQYHSQANTEGKKRTLGAYPCKTPILEVTYMTEDEAQKLGYLVHRGAYGPGTDSDANLWYIFHAHDMTQRQGRGFRTPEAALNFIDEYLRPHN